MRRARSSAGLLIVSFASSCASGAANGAEPTPALTESSAATPAEDPAARCRRLLSRYGAENAAAEQPRCERALTEGRSRERCAAVGKLSEFEACFEGCVRSVQADDAVDNCESPCAQIECAGSP